jgi:hypothetical protein
VPPVVSSGAPSITGFSASRRRVAAGVRLPSAGRVVVTLERGGSRVRLASVAASGPRTVQVRVARTAAMRPGRYRLVARFTARGATVAATAVRTIRLR